MPNDTRNKKLKAAGIKQLQSRQFLAAKKTYHSIYKKDNRDIDTILNLGVVYAQLKDYLNANKYFKLANNLLPGNAVILTNLGRSLLMLKDYQEAKKYLEQAIVIDNNNLQIKHLLVNACKCSGDLPAAASILQSILELNPDDYNASIQLGNMYMELSRFDSARNRFIAAININDKHALAYICLANLLVQQGDLVKADEILAQALAIEPQNNQAITVQAVIARYKGEHDKAFQILLRQIQQGYISVSLLINFSAIANTPDRTQQAIDLIENNIDELSLEEVQKRSLYFSLGKLYDSKNCYQQAFSNYQTANRLKSVSFDAAVFAQEIDVIRKVFTRQALQQPDVQTNQSGKPVFIVGMPRSGSTLVEQILLSHKKVSTVSESDQINNIFKQIAGTNSLLAYAGILQAVKENTVPDLASQYIQEIEKLTADKPSTRIMDKGLINFLHLGLIQLLFPNARVIHCIRNPLDTCLSCYFQDFTGSHPYSFDLVHLGHYYNSYKKLMQHWQDVLTIPVYEIVYEELVADPGQHSKDLVRFLDIEWDEQCLKYYESQRSVVTSSSEQVRKPVYSDSVCRYKNYEKHIQPLIAALQNNT